MFTLVNVSAATLTQRFLSHSSRLSEKAGNSKQICHLVPFSHAEGLTAFPNKTVGLGLFPPRAGSCPSARQRGAPVRAETRKVLNKCSLFAT